MFDLPLFGKVFFETTFVSSLHKVLREGNPEKYTAFAGNCCRQTAVFGAYFLTGMFPAIDCVVWEARFKDKLNGNPVEYDHAWIYAKHDTRKFLIDYARTHKECLFLEVKKNGYPKDGDYKDMIEIERTRLNWQEMMSLPEWYTQLPSKEVANLISEQMRRRISEINVR